VVFTAVAIGRTIPCAAVRSALLRLETWLWTGPLGHFVAGAIDWVTALARYGADRVLRARRRRRT
jgi:hypothetical protein